MPKLKNLYIDRYDSLHRKKESEKRSKSEQSLCSFSPQLKEGGPNLLSLRASLSLKSPAPAKDRGKLLVELDQSLDQEFFPPSH